MAGALTGLRVLEIVGVGPGPFAAMMLADHGAEVLRIHPPRSRAPLASLDGPADVLARSRPSIALDLKAPEGRAALVTLAACAEALIEGFRPGVAERLGIGPAECHAVNPALVYGRMTGWGQDGPLAETAGHDINYVALTGALHAIGSADKPEPPLNLLGDFGGGGLVLAFGMLAAILSARATGRGQVVDTAMTDGVALLSAMIHGLRAGGEWPGGRGDNLLDGGAPFYGTYACADGRFVAVGAIEPPFFAALCDGLGLDPAGFEPRLDRALWPGHRARIAAAFATAPRDHWARVFHGTDACVTPVLDWDEAIGHPHNRARGTFAAPGGIPQPAPAPRLSATPAAAPRPPERPAANGDLLAAWGLDPDRQAALRRAGILTP
ncbi:CoA transferase [Rhodobacterales bacterium HKCCE2091]|nr:CoA transferase [Rhodobacterales bacterium HKCCE2091]